MIARFAADVGVAGDVAGADHEDAALLVDVALGRALARAAAIGAPAVEPRLRFDRAPDAAHEAGGAIGLLLGIDVDGGADLLRLAEVGDVFRPAAADDHQLGAAAADARERGVE